MDTYIYDGPVKEFDRIINPNWKAQTMAVSKKKAKSNLEFRYKKEHGKARNVKISLPGKLEVL